MNMTLDEVSKGMSVNVERMEGDLFNHSFSGTVIGFRFPANGPALITVEDEDGFPYDVELGQLSHNSDECVH